MTVTDAHANAVTTGAATTPLGIEVAIAAGRLTLVGELDLSTVDVLRRAAAVLLACSGGDVTIDLDRLQSSMLSGSVRWFGSRPS